MSARWLITILDDHSRFVTGSEIFNEGTAENVIRLFDQAIDEYSKPRGILTDHGSQFWSVRRGESSFDTYCEQHGIKHILGGIGKPQSRARLNDGFEPTTSNMQGSPSTGNSSNTTTTTAHIWR